MRLLSIYFVILTFLSINPWIRPDSGQAIDNISWDKIDHAAAYCLFSLLFMSAYRCHKQRWAVSFIGLLSCSLAGVLLEYCQLWFTSTRQFSYHDAIANALGAAVGVILFWCYSFVAVKRVSQL